MVRTHRGGSNNVSVIDTATNSVGGGVEVATVPVGPRSRGVAITPDGKHAYVTNTAPPTVHCLGDHTATNTVMTTVAAGSTPLGWASFRRPGGALPRD